MPQVRTSVPGTNKTRRTRISCTCTGQDRVCGFLQGKPHGVRRSHKLNRKSGEAPPWLLQYRSVNAAGKDPICRPPNHEVRHKGDLQGYQNCSTLFVAGCEKLG